MGADGTIYVGSSDDNLYAINPDGSLKWKFATSSSIFSSSPAVGADGTIYVGSLDDNLYAINPDGSQKWKFTSGDAVLSSPAVGADGTICVGSWDDNLYALGPSISPTPTATATPTPVPPPPPPVTLSTLALSFAPEPVGSTSVQPLYLTNNQSVTLPVTGFTVTGAFSQTNQCTGTDMFGQPRVAPYSNCEIDVTFAPTAAGKQTGTMTVTYVLATGKTGQQTVSLSGTGLPPAVALDPASVKFGKQEVGTASSTLTATLTNNQKLTLNISGIGVGGTNSGDFAISSETCGSTLGARQNCTIMLKFTPSATGARKATLSVSDSPDPKSPETVSLSGTGVPPVTLTPATVSFANQEHGTISSPETVTLTNNQSAKLTITSAASLGGTNPGDFEIASTTCGATLDAKKSCTVTVKFKPTAAGSRSATLSVSDSPDPNSPETVSLSGKGT